MSALEEADAPSENLNESASDDAEPNLIKKASLKDRRRASLIRRKGLSEEDVDRAEMGCAQSRSTLPPKNDDPFEGRDRAVSIELRAAAQKRLEVKIRARKVLAKNAARKERASTARADIDARLSILSKNTVLGGSEGCVDPDPTEVSSEEQADQAEEPGSIQMETEGAPFPGLSSTEATSSDSPPMAKEEPEEQRQFSVPAGLSKEGQARFLAVRERRARAEAEKRANEEKSSMSQPPIAKPEPALTGAL